VQRGEETEGEAGAKRGQARKHDHPLAQLERDQRSVVCGHDRRNQIERPCRDEQPGHGSERRKQNRLGQQLRDELPAVGADRQTHGHLRGAAGAADQQQVGDVRAGDQQHRAGDREQNDQRGSRLVVEAALPAAALFERDLLRLEQHHRLVAHALLQRRLDIVEDRAIRAVDRNLRLL
jgi:hypothetical protein